MLKKLFAPGPRFVLVIGNAGAVLTYFSDLKIAGQWTVEGSDEKSLAVLSEALTEHHRVPVTVLIDMVEQTYREETIPPVGILDRPKVLQRRLNIAYPSFDIKAAISLHEKIGRRGDFSYLFVALPPSPYLETWIGFLLDTQNPVNSLGLLPVEGVSLADSLAEAVLEEEEERSGWTLLIGLHQTGGFRQIVVHNSRLALTRLTPGPALETEMGNIGVNIQQELNSTLGYLSRLNYRAEEGLDVIIIGNERLRETLNEATLPVRSVNVLTLPEAGRLIGFEEVVDPAGNYADILHAAWIAGKRAPELQLASKALGRRRLQVAALRQIAVSVLSFAAVILVAYMGVLAFEIWNTRDSMDDDIRLRARLEGELTEARRRIKEYPDQPKVMTNTLKVYDLLEAESVRPLPILAGIAESIGPGHRLRNIAWETVQEVVTRRNRGKARKKGQAPTVKILFTVDFSAYDDAEAAIAETYAIQDRLSKRFEGLEVVLERPPLNILPTQKFVRVSGGDSAQQAKVSYSADFSVQGQAT